MTESIPAERDRARMAEANARFVAEVTLRLNRLGVPATPDWPTAFDWLEAHVTDLRAENERLRNALGET